MLYFHCIYLSFTINQNSLATNNLCKRRLWGTTKEQICNKLRTRKCWNIYLVDSARILFLHQFLVNIGNNLLFDKAGNIFTVLNQKGH